METLLLHLLLLGCPGMGSRGPGSAGMGPDAVLAAGPWEAVWVEGENATAKGVVRNAKYDDVNRSLLSGEDWLSHAAQGEGRAGYNFDIVEPGDYTFWWRGNIRGKMQYALDGSSNFDMDFSRGVEDIRPLSEKEDYRDLGWFRVGRFTLDAGTHSLSFLFKGDPVAHGGIDCFCFTRAPFEPDGIRRPVVRRAWREEREDWFPVSLGEDAFSDASASDFSKSLPSPAGRDGFLRADGGALSFEKGTGPVRFWGVSFQGSHLPESKEAERLARFYSKLGINILRLPSVFDFTGPPLKGGDCAPGLMDKLDWLFFQMKRRGIYMHWCLSGPMSIGPDSGISATILEDLLREDELRASARGFVNFESELQEFQLAYMRGLLTHKNLYTGLAYVDDPALAVLEFQNEDCIFGNFPLSELAEGRYPRIGAKLRGLWCRWARDTYGSDSALSEAWGPLRQGESLEHGELAIYAAYELGPDGPRGRPSERRRAGDFIRFLSSLQRGYYQTLDRAARGLGFKGVTVSSAGAGGGQASELASLYCDSSCDMISRQVVYGGGAGGQRQMEGFVSTQSMLRAPGTGILAAGFHQVAEKPFACGEWASLPPNPWRLEAAPLVALYGMGLQGWDLACCLIPEMLPPDNGEGGRRPLLSAVACAQLAALSSAVRQGLVREASVALERGFKPDDLSCGVDLSGLARPEAAGKTGIAPDTLALGKSLVYFDGRTGLKGGNLEPGPGGVLRSSTGELSWDRKAGRVLLSSPGFQLLLGNTGGGTFSLPDFRLRVETPFVSIIFTALDGRPLSDSGSVLVTALAREKLDGEKLSSDGKKLLAVGRPPLLMEPVRAWLAFTGRQPSSLRVLDVFGVPTGAEISPDKDGWYRIDGSHRTFLYQALR